MAGQLLVNANVGKRGAGVPHWFYAGTTDDSSRHSPVQPHRGLLLHEQFTQAAFPTPSGAAGVGRSLKTGSVVAPVSFGPPVGKSTLPAFALICGGAICLQILRLRPSDEAKAQLQPCKLVALACFPKAHYW